jgi:two-component system, sensor histidine kinase
LRVTSNELNVGIGTENVDILVVDDRPDGLVAIEALLANCRVNVVKANSGPEAIALLPRHDFAVILLDVQMPGMDGFEVAERIKHMERFRYIPIIFVTAINNDDRYIFRGYETGAVDYVFKPFDPMILRSKVSVFVDLFLQAKRIRQQEARLIENERSERIRQLAELEVESLRRYRGLADAIPHVICRAGADGTLDYFNRGWTDLTGFSIESSVGTGWQRAIHEEDLPQVLKIWVDAIIEGSDFECEARIYSHTGEARWHLLRFVPERRLGGDIVAWIGTATDIHDRKKTEREVRLAKDAAESANIAKTEFLANVSHEIRTPLSAILGFSELLTNPVQSLDDKLQCARTIRRNGEQLLHLINEILDISKVESGKLEIESVPVDMEQMFGELRSLFELKAAEKSLLFHIECETEIPGFIMSDPMRLRQILINVIGNAVKFTEIGSVQVFARCQRDKAERGTCKIILRVEDTGIGIQKGGDERLFEPFTQADSSTTRRFGGTGLGLALSRKLARSLGGDVKVLNSSKTGSTFEIRIESSIVKERADRVIPAGSFGKSTSVATVPIEANAQALVDRTILLVDDAVDNQVLISRFLRMAGAKVEVAGNGLEAVNKAHEKAYDLILMDIQMPTMDGYSAARQLRSEGLLCPIIALTAHALKTERVKCLAAGFDDHLSKPVDRLHLVQHVAHWLEKPINSSRNETVSLT